MVALLQVSLLVLLGICGVMVGCGALALLTGLPRLLSRQRATLYGVSR